MTFDVTISRVLRQPWERDRVRIDSVLHRNQWRPPEHRQPGSGAAGKFDVAATLRKLYFWASGDAGLRDQKTPNPFGLVARQAGLLDALPEPASLPAWLEKADFDVFVRAYEASGFRGGLNYYRNLDRNWELQAAFMGLPVRTPALYLVGEYDTGLAIPGMHEIIGGMRRLVPNLRNSQIIPRAGHWLQQEAPDLVNTAVIEFLHSL